MTTPFPGMDPYLEHPVLWTSVHTRLIVALANQIRPHIRPRYIATVGERIFVEGPQKRVPDVWVQKTAEVPGTVQTVTAPLTDSAVIVKVEGLELHEKRIEILDAYKHMKLVTVIEIVSPTNKVAGMGRTSYLDKQEEIRGRDCHLVEIDLLRMGKHAACVPQERVQELGPYAYLACVNRWPERSRFELYPRTLRQRLPRMSLPLAAPDPDVALDLQAAFEQVYEDGDYMLRVRYDEPCEPELAPADQQWANECWATYRAAHPELVPPPP